jgi:hypothetical protein
LTQAPLQRTALRLPISIISARDALALKRSGQRATPNKYGLHHYLLVNRSVIGQNMLLMKRCLFLLGFIVAAVCSSLSAQTVLSILQENTGKTVELHLQAGDKIGGKVEQVNESVVHLSHLTGAEFFDAFVNVNDISAVVIRTGGK